MMDFTYLPDDHPRYPQFVNLATILRAIDKGEEGIIVYFVDGSSFTFLGKQAKALVKILREES